MTATTVPDPALTQPHLSARAVKCILIYLESVLGEEATEDLVRSTGMEPDFLRDENNWVSYEYQHRLLQRCVEATGDPEAPFKAGTFAGSPQVLGALYLVLRPFGTPEMVYRALPDFIPRMSRTGSFSVDLRKGHARIDFRLKPQFRQNRSNCQNIQGQLAAVPTAWGLPLAEVRELECQVDGAEACRYEVVWRRPHVLHLFGLAAGLLAGGALALAPFTVLETPDQKVLTFLLCGGLGYFAGLSRFLLATLEENRGYQGRQTQVLTENMRTMEQKFLELRKAHGSIRQSSLEMTALYRVATVGSRRVHLREMVPDLLSTLVESPLGIREALLVLRAEEEDPYVWRWPPRTEEASLQIERAADDALRAGRALTADELEGIRLEGQPLPSALKSVKTVAVPLQSSGRTLGVLVLGVERDSPTVSSSGFAMTLAGEVALAVEGCQAWDAIESLLENLPIAVMIVDDHCTVEFLNPAFRALFDDPPDEPSPLHLADLVGLPAPLRDAMVQEARTLSTGPAEVDCGRRVIAYRSFRIRSREQRRVRIGFALTDVTEQKKLVRQLVQSERLAGIGTLASGVAHEINNPLFAISGLAEILASRLEDPLCRRHAQKIVEYSASIAQIVEELSRYSRAGSTSERAPVDLAACVKKGLALLRHHREFRSATVEADLQPVRHVLGNEQELVQVVVNLVQNAVQATEGAGSVRVSTAQQGDRVSMTVRDTGHGIPDEHLEQLFDAFFTTKPPGRGTGLGLFVVHRIITAHGGSVRVDRPPDGGAAFVVELPPADPGSSELRMDLPLGPGST